ncbi:uncharacterized protein LOC119651643 [Hermetia illucens]|uniref:uncharacterized protein LOC119651643 n=1 Tax=Hermetia illucens TaxID=343691 RepID=UPI0018CBF7E2|nr:uncharacterized protein LOC119651643 [Hermetia illucens]
MSSGQTVSTTSVPTLPPSPFPSPPACELSSVQSPRGSTPGALGGLSDPEKLTTSTSANEDDDEEMHDDLYWTASKVNEDKDNDDNASGGQAHPFSNCSHNDNGNVQISQKSENQQKSNGMCNTGCGCYTKNTCNTKYSHATPKKSYDGNLREFIDEDNSNQDDIINQRYISDDDQLKMYFKPAGHTNEQDQTEKVEAVRIIRVEKHTQLRALSYRGVSVNNMHGDNGHIKHARQSKMQAKVMETHTKYVLCEIVRDMKTTRNPYDDCTKEGAGDFSIPNKSESDTLASQENLMQDVDYLGKQLNSIQNSFDKHDEKYEPLLGEGTDTPSQTKTNQSATIVSDTLQVGLSPKDIRCSSQAIDSLHRKIVHLEAVIATLSSENKSFIRDYVEYRNILSCYQNDLRKYVQAISERSINPRFQREPSKESSKAEWITYSRKVMQEVKAARGQKFALEATRKERDSLLLERNSLQKKLEIYAKLQEYFLAQHFGPPLKFRVRRLTKSAKKYKALVNQYKSSNRNLLKQRKEASSALRIYEEILQLREKELQMITALATEEIQNLKQEKESFLRQFEIEKTGGRKLCRERKNSTQSLEEFKLKQGDQRREDASESDAMSAGKIFPEKNGRETTYPKVGFSTLQQLPVDESSERLAADIHQLQDFLQNVQQKIHYLLHDTFQYSKEDVKNELMKISRYIDEIKQKMNRISKESCLIPNGKETAAHEEDPKLHDICIKIILQGVGELYEDDFTYLQSRIQSARQTKNKDWDSESSNDDSSASSEYSTVNFSKYKLETDDENPEDLLHNLQYSDDERNIF